MEATAVPDMKNSSSTIRFFFSRRELEQSKQWWVEGTRRNNRDSVQDDAASDAVSDDKCPIDYSQTQPQFPFKLYIREKAFVHPKLKHNSPPHLHTVAVVRSPPTLQAGQLGSCSCILTQRGFVHWSVGTDEKAGKVGKTRTNRASSSPPLNVLEGSGSQDKSLWFKDTE